ncbi:MAG: radical SAM protein [Sulfurisoma sp.]|nr:radical SAM protein [Sulfurisoma sp.]
MLTTTDHSRDAAGLRYVYPVVSRRAGGISIGINLNPNNACNWRCVYCQVPDLKRGGPPPIDLGLLEAELDELLRRVASADFLAELAPPGARRIVDVAFSGNGEPTSAPEFGSAVDIVERVLVRHGLLGTVKIRLITNGSLVDRLRVRAALARLGQLGGEVWFKVDAVSTKGTSSGASPAPTFRVNGVRLNADTMRRRLRLCGGLVPTWVQTCVFEWDGSPPAATEVAAYLDFLASMKDAVAGVLLYGLARPSCQPEAGRLGRLPEIWLAELAWKIEKLGLTVRVSP